MSLVCVTGPSEALAALDMAALCKLSKACTARLKMPSIENSGLTDWSEARLCRKLPEFGAGRDGSLYADKGPFHELCFSGSWVNCVL